PPESRISTSSWYLPGSRGADTAIVIVCASFLTRRAATLVDRVGSGMFGTGAAGDRVAEPLRGATTSSAPGPDGAGGSSVPATASESSAIVLHVAPNSIAAGIAPP